MGQELIVSTPSVLAEDFAEDKAFFAEEPVANLVEERQLQVNNNMPDDPVAAIQSGSFLPTLQSSEGMMVFILNVVFPGLGSWIAAIIDPNGFNLFLFIVGWLQAA